VLRIRDRGWEKVSIRITFIFTTQVETRQQEEEDLFARALSGLGEDDGNAAVEFVYDEQQEN
jgi:hypothetical protein